MQHYRSDNIPAAVRKDADFETSSSYSSVFIAPRLTVYDLYQAYETRSVRKLHLKASCYVTENKLQLIIVQASANRCV